MKFHNGLWAVIVGGSSGFGLAAAQKLASHGMNLCIIHRDRRGAMSRITPEFERLAQTGVRVLTFNLDGLSTEGRTEVLNALAGEMGDTGRVRLLLHAVAFGNLKLLAPYDPKNHARKARQKIAEYAGISETTLDQSISRALDDGCDAIYPLVEPPVYDTRNFLNKDDFSHTLQAMGSNIAEWVQDVFHRGLFAPDARVLSLTSEGNSVAWRGYAAVAAAKAVLESVSRAMAVEFAPFGIRVNVIQAGVTETAALSAIPGNRQIRANAALRNPMGRLTRPADVADAIYLLCRDEAAWINGALIRVDGGESIA